MWHTKQYPLDKDILLLPEEKAFQSFEKRLRRTCGYLEFLSWTGLWENSHLGTLSPQWNQWSGWYPNTVWIHKGIVYFRGYTSHTLGNSTVLCCSYNIYIYILQKHLLLYHVCWRGNHAGSYAGGEWSKRDSVLQCISWGPTSSSLTS